MGWVEKTCTQTTLQLLIFGFLQPSIQKFEDLYMHMQTDSTAFLILLGRPTDSKKWSQKAANTEAIYNPAVQVSNSGKYYSSGLQQLVGLDLHMQLRNRMILSDLIFGGSPCIFLGTGSYFLDLHNVFWKLTAHLRNSDLFFRLNTSLNQTRNACQIPLTFFEMFWLPRPSPVLPSIQAFVSENFQCFQPYILILDKKIRYCS